MGGRGPDSSVVKAPASGARCRGFHPGRAISNALKWYQWLPWCSASRGNHGFSSPLNIVSLRPDFFYFLVLGSFLTKVWIGGENKNKNIS